MEKSVLNHEELDVGVEAGTAQSGCLLGVEAGGLHQIESGILTQGLYNLIYDESFIFLFHSLY